MSDEDRNLLGGFNSSTYGNLNSGNAGQQYSAGVNAFDSESLASLKMHNHQMNQIRNGNYAGSSSSSSGHSVLGEIISGLFEVFVKIIGFFFKVIFYYMPKYHTKTFIVFLLAMAVLVTINSPQVDKWNSDGQWALAPTSIKYLPSSSFGLPKETPSKMNGFKSLMTTNDFDNRALFAMYKSGYDKGTTDFDKHMFERVLRDRLLFKTPEPVMGKMPGYIAKNLHREALSPYEEAEFILISCSIATNFNTFSFPNMSKEDRAKTHLDRALMEFNKECNGRDKYPIGMVEYLLRISQSKLDTDGLDYLKKIQSSPVFIFDRHKQDVSGMLTIFLGILLTWVSIRRDCGKEKKAVTGATAPVENPADFSAKK